MIIAIQCMVLLYRKKNGAVNNEYVSRGILAIDSNMLNMATLIRRFYVNAIPHGGYDYYAGLVDGMVCTHVMLTSLFFLMVYVDFFYKTKDLVRALRNKHAMYKSPITSVAKSSPGFDFSFFFRNHA